MQIETLPIQVIYTIAGQSHTDDLTIGKLALLSGAPIQVGKLDIQSVNRLVEGGVAPLYPLLLPEWDEIFAFATRRGAGAMPIPLLEQWRAFSEDQLIALKSL